MTKRPFPLEGDPVNSVSLATQHQIHPKKRDLMNGTLGSRMSSQTEQVCHSRGIGPANQGLAECSYGGAAHWRLSGANSEDASLTKCVCVCLLLLLRNIFSFWVCVCAYPSKPHFCPNKSREHGTFARESSARGGLARFTILQS